ncbi:RHS repeat-associated core domain-containing protein [Prevotella jejuni]
MRISYDAYDLPVEVTSGNEVWTMEYTPMGNLRRQTRRTSSMRMVSALNYEYDSYDQLRFVENEHGERYFFERNLNGEIICERGFDGAERHYIRDLDGTVITTQLPDGTAVHHQHDQAGRLTYNKYTDGSWEAWEYDKAGRLTKAYNRDSVTEFVRNALGQVIKETQDGRTVEHRYDERSRLSNIVSALGGNITYGYDIKGAVNHISAGMSGKRKPWEANIAYDRFGRETSRMMPGSVENTMHYDSIGRPAHQRVRHNGRTLLDKSYTWGDNLRLLRTFDTINGRSVRYDYDAFGSLSGAVYGDGSCQWRNPDAMGNVYDSPDRTDRSYGRGGQLREDRKWRYYYDSHGNLVLKTMRRMEPSRNAEARDEFLQWQSGDYAYTWQGNGMLRSVTRPDGKTVIFRYDPLGRRIEKVFDGRVYRYLWDGDVILHEWDYAEADRPNTIVTEAGEVTLDRPEPVENLITWVYDSDSYVPTAKIVGDRHYSIISDYIGRPAQAYDDKGNVVWQVDYDIYGNLRNLHGGRRFIPFRQLGQYEDEETGLYYNRFRYYDPKIGNYISQDPIGLAGNNPTLYAFVTDPNLWKDMFGLDVSSGAGRTHVTYHGIKNGKPYTGYASAPSELGLSASEIVSRRYGGDFSQFGGRAPEVLYKGEDISGKHTARGLEQRFYEMDVNKFGKEGVANKQNPVGKNNKNRQSYLDTADSFLEKNKITCS